jgi:peptidyl-tRNA hydrolase
MKIARYIFLNRGLEMTPGKCAAQAAHAETLAMHDYFDTALRLHILDPEERIRQQIQEELYAKWYGDGHYAKYVVTAKDSQAMFTTERYLNDRDFKTYLVIDEGHTEGTYMVPTAMAVELVDKDDERVDSIFKIFRLYKPLSPSPPKKRRLRDKLSRSA